LRESLAPAPSVRPVAAGGASSVTMRLAKRMLDLTVATACLIMGRNRRTFELCKFRTMYTGCPDDVHREYVRKLLTDDQPPDGGRPGVFKLENDDRITPLGRLLRRTSIDELPQLINVIRGDMSLVGPRPALPWEARLFDAVFFRRFAVPPGLTGLWQVSGRNSLTMRQGLELDLEYVRRQSLALDLWILIKTIPVVLSTRGAL
jgi:lipopolysaccharide/colanic/teichoic acid biosynthesis glycosyltransferase